MTGRPIGAMIAITVVLGTSPISLAQNSKQKPGAAAASTKSFDAHDLSGFWEITNLGRPSGALNETSNNRPPMTPSGLEKFHKTKTGYDAKSLGNGVSPNQKDWNDPVRWCDPTGFPRVLWSPTAGGMRIAQAADEVIQFFETDRA